MLEQHGGLSGIADRQVESYLWSNLVTPQRERQYVEKRQEKEGERERERKRGTAMRSQTG